MRTWPPGGRAYFDRPVYRPSVKSAAAEQAGWTMTDQRDATEPSVAFEVAAEILDQLIGYAAGRVSASRLCPSPGQDAVEWQRRLAEWSQRRRELMPADSAAIALVLDVDAATLRSLPTDEP